MLSQVGSWAGNLMLMHAHDNFPSDVFTVMEAAGASVTIGEYVIHDVVMRCCQLVLLYVSHVIWER